MDNSETRTVTLEELEKYFPYTKARPGQLEACQRIINAFFAGKKNVIVDAPTGVGKSCLAICVSNFFIQEFGWEGFLTTPLKTLQNQYAADPAFADSFAMIKGRTAYPCALAHFVGKARGFDAADEEGIYEHYCSAIPDAAGRGATRKRCQDQGICEFYSKLATAQETKLVLNNTSTLIYQQLPFAPFFEHRDFFIADEAHLLENTIMSMFSFPYTEKFAHKYGLHVFGLKWEEPPAANPYTPTKTLLAQLHAVHQVLQGMDFEDMDEKEAQSAQTMLRNLDVFLVDPSVWVCDVSKGYYVFKPLYPQNFAWYITAKAAKFRVFMSATILDYKTFAAGMDLDLDETEYISLPSTFPVENRPIYEMVKYGITSLNYKELDANMPRLLAGVDDIISSYAQCKGIIHTHTNKIADYILMGSKHRHRLITHTPHNREGVLRRFIESKEPLVLMSPSMVEGIDLKDDLGRFQVLCKCPYPFLGDAQIKARSSREPAWYQWKTTLAIIQAAGRIVRHERDWGHTYVLDPAFRQWAYTVRDLLPEYFKKAVQWNCKEVKGPR